MGGKTKAKALKVKKPPKPASTKAEQDGGVHTRRFLLGPCTVDDLREAQDWMGRTFTPWPAGSTPESVAASIRRLRAAGLLPERNPS